jgi:pimeloyl-ACP methyl ester carboxylesterase
VTDGPVPRPGGLLMVRGGGFDTRYREWGTGGTPIVLVPGAFETADTFDALGLVLRATHRVYAIDLTGTGYSAPSPPYTAAHEAGADDPQMSAADAAATARRIGAPAPATAPGRHLTMISSPSQVAAALRGFLTSMPR